MLIRYNLSTPIGCPAKEGSVFLRTLFIICRTRGGEILSNLPTSTIFHPTTIRASALRFLSIPLESTNRS